MVDGTWARTSESAIFLEVHNRDELLVDIAGQVKRYPETLRLETPDVVDGAVMGGSKGMLKSLLGAAGMCKTNPHDRLFYRDGL